MRFVTTSFQSWRAGIAASGQTLPEAAASEAISLNTHHFRHAAEILTIRDLYRAVRPLDPDPLVDACLRGDEERIDALLEHSPPTPQHEGLVTTIARMGHWHLMAKLLQRGFPPAGSSGASALHHAAANAPLECVRTLVEHGADVNAKDPEWSATPLGWAEYFGRAQAADYLRPLTST